MDSLSSAAAAVVAVSTALARGCKKQKLFVDDNLTGVTDLQGLHRSMRFSTSLHFEPRLRSPLSGSRCCTTLPMLAHTSSPKGNVSIRADEHEVLLTLCTTNNLSSHISFRWFDKVWGVYAINLQFHPHSSFSHRELLDPIRCIPEIYLIEHVGLQSALRLN